jgi:hypothetical protein
MTSAADRSEPNLSTGRRRSAPHRGGEAMTDRSGSVAYLRRMAERCRRAAAEMEGTEARELVELARRCEDRIAERERADEMLAAEE